jgi:multiple sugar transport system ATP-binding protein
MAEVTLTGVNKVYPGDVQAVKDFNLHIDDREFLVLVGRSGCGKSTTLRMIAGLEEATSGTITIGERVVNDIPPKDRDIAMVFQDYALYPHMTVYDNMAFGLKLRKVPKPEIDRRVRDAAGLLGIDQLLDRRPKALSGGQRQRVAMGRAIVREPALFLFDEPLSNLDAKMRGDMRKEILRLHRQIRRTMVYVTHDQVEAMTLGDRIVVMRDGLIEQVAEPEVVYLHPATLFVARFIGTPPRNVFTGRLVADGDGVAFDGGNFKAPLPPEMAAKVRHRVDRKVYLGIRPKAFVLKERAVKADAGVSIRGRVDVSEMVGEEVLVHLVSGEHQFTVSVSPHNRPVLVGDLEVCPILSLAHIFDGEAEENLTMPDYITRSGKASEAKRSGDNGVPPEQGPDG